MSDLEVLIALPLLAAMCFVSGGYALSRAARSSSGAWAMLCGALWIAGIFALVLAGAAAVA